MKRMGIALLLVAGTLSAQSKGTPLHPQILCEFDRKTSLTSDC